MQNICEFVLIPVIHIGILALMDHRLRLLQVYNSQRRKKPVSQACLLFPLPAKRLEVPIAVTRWMGVAGKPFDIARSISGRVIAFHPG